MSGVTNDLISKSQKICQNFSDSEHDVLVSSGEQVACSLIAGRLIHKGFKSRSWLAWQIPIVTKGSHKNSRISLINKKKIASIKKELKVADEKFIEAQKQLDDLNVDLENIKNK